MASDICYVCGTRNMRGSVCLTCCPDGDPRLKPSNTPIAPVSPDATGKCGELVTAEAAFNSTFVSHPYTAGDTWVSRKRAIASIEALRSQAVELLATERAEREELDAECRVLAKRCIEKDARIKELDQCHEGTIDLCNQKTAEIKALEAKLAAAEKVREAAIELDEAISDDFNIFGAQQKLRAALGGKPS